MSRATTQTSNGLNGSAAPSANGYRQTSSRPSQPPLTPTDHHHQDSIWHSIDAFFNGVSADGVGVNEGAVPLEVEDCLTYLVNFVKMHELEYIIGRGVCLDDEGLRERLYPEAVIAAQLPVKLRHISSELAMPLTILCLYDLAVLIDDSASMKFTEGGRRIDALKDVLYFLARLYGTVSNDMRGIKAIRFLNNTTQLKIDDLTTKHQIDSVINSHNFEGLTRIGAGLMRHILKPFVFEDDPSWVPGTPKKLQAMERPLLIMVITDGAVEGEPEGWVEKAVKNVIDAVGMKDKGVLFQFARVGNDAEAEKFLKYLDEESYVKDYVDTLSGNDLMDLVGARAGSRAPKDLQDMIKLLLGPICECDRLDEGLTDVENDFNDPRC